MNFVFISHSNKPDDLAFCLRLYRYLTEEKRICVWMDAPDMRSGDWREQIYRHIVDASAYILVASRNSLIESDEVAKEIDNMLNAKGKPFIPIALDDSYMTQDKGKGSIGYELGEGRFQAVIMNNYPNEQAAFERLLFLLPRELTQLENNPNDFVYSNDNETLIRYSGKDPYVKVPSFVKKIGKEAFVCNDSLETVFIPSSVTEIGIRAFYGCNHLSRVEGMTGVVDLDASAFQETRAFDRDAEFSVMNGVLLCGGETRKDLVLPEVRMVANSAYECCDAETIVMPDTLEVLGRRAFADSDSITEIRIPKSVRIIGKGAFTGCARLRKAVIEGGDTEIVDKAFDSNVEIVEE